MGLTAGAGAGAGAGVVFGAGVGAGAHAKRAVSKTTTIEITVIPKNTVRLGVFILPPF